jgi:hypothetical protein
MVKGPIVVKSRSVVKYWSGAAGGAAFGRLLAWRATTFLVKVVKYWSM